MGRSLHFINICLLILLISIIFITPETRGLEDNLDNTIVYAVANYGLDTYSQYGSTFVLSEAYWLWTVRGSLYRNDVLEEEGKHVPELADSEPVISADGLNWTIKLKDNLKFASGNPMTAQDVVFTWQTHMTPAIQSPFYFWMIYLFESNSSITKINENTISFVFKQVSQFHYFILSSISIVDFDQYGGLYQSCLDGVINDCVWDDDDGSFAPNSGAFTVDSIDSEGSEIHLIKNQNYYNAKNMQIDRLTFKFVNVTTESSKNDVLDMIELGIIDVIDWTIIQDGFNNDLAQFSGYQNLDLISVLGQSYQEISINHLHPIYGTGEDIPNDTGVSTNDAVQATMVRKAMSHLVNREFIANVILNKSGAPASVSLYPHAPGFESGLPQYRNYSIATAKNYMEMAGFEFSDLIDGNNDGDYNDEVDSPFFSVDIIIFPSSSSPGRPQWTEMFANELSNIGVGANVTVLSFGAYANRTFNGGFNWSNENPTLIPLHKDGGFDIALLGYVQNALDFSMPTWYRSDRLYDQVSDEVNFDNWINFIDAEITQLIIDYGVATEVTERIRIVHELQEKIYDTIPTIPIIYPIHYSYSGDTIVGINKKLLDSGELYWPDVYDSEWESQGPELNSDDDLISEQNQNIIVGVMVVAIIVVVISKFLTRKKGFP